MIKRITTHVSVDLDAVIGTCCELIRHNLIPSVETVKFVDADIARVPADTLAVDIRARKHGRGKSYVGYYCRDILPYQICDEVDEQDSTGRSSSRVPLFIVPAALQKVGMSDLEIVQHMYPIVHGWIQLRIEWDAADAIVEQMDKVTIGDYSFLISLNNNNRGLSSAAKRLGLDGNIFWSKTGCGIVSYDKYILNFAHMELDGWYADSRGFLFAYGTRKSPKEIPPPQFSTVEVFIEWLKTQEVFYNG